MKWEMTRPCLWSWPYTSSQKYVIVITLGNSFIFLWRNRKGNALCGKHFEGTVLKKMRILFFQCHTIIPIYLKRDIAASLFVLYLLVGLLNNCRPSYDILSPQMFQALFFFLFLFFRRRQQVLQLVKIDHKQLIVLRGPDMVIGYWHYTGFSPLSYSVILL